jgi:hypothetical protein
MTLNRPLLFALALSLPPLSAAPAQWPSELAQGGRVQVQLPEQQYQLDARRGQLVRGRVTGLAADTLYLAVTDSLGPLAIPRRLIQRIAVSRGVPSRGASAIRRGIASGIGGALLGLGIGLLDDDIDDSDAALIGAAIGFGTGAVSGALWPHERWKKLNLTTVTSGVGGPGLRLAIGTTF